MAREPNFPPILLAGLHEATAPKRPGLHLSGQLGGATIAVIPNRDRRGQSDPTHLLVVLSAGELKGQR